TYDDHETFQTAVARGGAYHALLLTVTGNGLFQPVASDSIYIQTENGPVELIPGLASLPYPGTGKRWAESRQLAVPVSSMDNSVEVRVELRDSHDAILEMRVFEIPAPVRKGEPLVLRYRMDENQVLRFTVALAKTPEEVIDEGKVESPLTHVINPSKARTEIDRLEEALRTNRVPREEWVVTLARLAALYEEINQLERALDRLKKAVQVFGSPNPYLLNRMALICDRLHDYERAERLFQEATELGDDGAAQFNLALSFKRRGMLDRACECILGALGRERLAPYLVLQAQLYNQLKDNAARDLAMEESMHLFGDMASMSDWEL